MDPVYFKTQSEIQRELSSGEKLLWSGRPRQGLRLNLSDLLVIPFSLVWCGFAIFWETTVIKGHGPLLLKLWGIPFVVAGLYLVFGRFFVDVLTRARTYYGVTNQRLVIVTDSFSRRVQTLPWQSLPKATLIQRGDSGIIKFGPQIPFGLSRSGNFTGLPGSGAFPFPALVLSDHVREAHAAITLAQEAAHREEPSVAGRQTNDFPATPAKLLPPPPRRVHGRLGGGLWFVRIFLLPHMLVGIGAVGYLVFLLLWLPFGVDYPATVVGSKISHSSKHGDTYTLRYRFEAGGETRFDSVSVGWPVYQACQNQIPGQTYPTLTAHYFGLGPLHHSALREVGSLWSEIGFLTLWAAFWNGVLSIFVYLIWVKPLRARSLYKYGASTSGKLLNKRVRTGKSATFYVSYEFNDPASGSRYESEIQVWRAGEWQEAVFGQPVTVLFAQNHPKRSTVYEFGGYRIEGV